jgi:hypothetical protein
VLDRSWRSRLCLLGATAFAGLLVCEIPSASAEDIDTHAASPASASQAKEANKIASDANALTTGEAINGSKPAQPSVRKLGSGLAKGPYYVDFRARTAASWGHAFVWYGKTTERKVEVAGLTPAGDVFEYVLGYATFVPSETGASYGDLDPQYLTAHYKVYLNEQDAKRVFAYIKKLQARSPVWNAETANCTAFIGDIAEFMGLKVPNRWQRPENYVKNLRAMNGARQTVRLEAGDNSSFPINSAALRDFGRRLSF